MITINLLPQKRRARISHVYVELFWAGVFLAVLLVGMGITSVVIQTRLSGLQKTFKQRETEKNALLVQVGRVNKLKKELEALEINIAAIRTIRIRQGLPVRYLDTIVSRMPGEKIWLESLSLVGENGIGMKGVALDNQVFARYVDGLRESPLIDRVLTQKTQLRSVQDLGLVEFQCSVAAVPPGVKENDHE